MKKIRLLNKNEYKLINDILQNSGLYFKKNLSEVHGFLTAISSAPSIISTNEWHDLLLDKRIHYFSKNDASDYLELLILFHRDIIETLAKKHFKPLLWERGNMHHVSSASMRAVSDWCKGYLKGVKLDNFWANHDEGLSLIMPVAALSGDVEFIQLIDNECLNKNNMMPNEEQKLRLPKVIKEIYLYWKTYLDREKQFAAEREPLDDQNTNDSLLNRLCYCHSGKKINECCWTNVVSLH